MSKKDYTKQVARRQRIRRTTVKINGLRGLSGGDSLFQRMNASFSETMFSGRRIGRTCESLLALSYICYKRYKTVL